MSDTPGDRLRLSIKLHTDWDNSALKDIGYALAHLLDKDDKQVDDLLETIRKYDHVIQAVATALGGVCCGGIDVDGPGSAKAVLVGAIEKLKSERGREHHE